MKMILFLCVFVFGMSSMVFSQTNRQKIQGPKAKNAKPWQREKATKKNLVYYKRTPFIKGPKAKNAKPWERSPLPELQPIVLRKLQLKGPKAKNYKIWSKSTKPITNKVTSSVRKSKKTVVNQE